MAAKQRTRMSILNDVSVIQWKVKRFISRVLKSRKMSQVLRIGLLINKCFSEKTR